jgi:hypothetical protein
MQLRDLWHSDLLPRFTQQWALVGLKSIMQFACAMSLGQLRPEHVEFIGGFRLPSKDKYATVRSGLVFLTMNEESSIVDHLDDLNSRLKAGVVVASAELCDACVLLLAYQYGFRRTQMARVRVEDVKVYDLADGDGPSVHVTFESLKQRWSARRHAMVRAIKRERAFMFEAFLSQRRAHPDKYVGANVVPGSLFGLSPADIAETIVRVTAAVTVARRTSCATPPHSGSSTLAPAARSWRSSWGTRPWTPGSSGPSGVNRRYGQSARAATTVTGVAGQGSAGSQSEGTPAPALGGAPSDGRPAPTPGV